MLQRMKNKVWLGLVVIVLIAAVCLLPFPRQINIIHEGILWRCGAPDQEENTEVTITGIYYDYAFRADDFQGSIRVESCPETHGELSIVPMGDGQFGIWRKTEDALLKSFGGMFLRKDGSVMLIIHEDGHWDADTGRMLTAPATTRAEAVALTNELAKELSPNWLGTWNFE